MKLFQSIKKGIATSFLVVGLLGSSNAQALPVLELGSITANIGDWITNISGLVVEGATLVSQKISEKIQEYSWIQQLIDNVEQITDATKQAEELLHKVEGVTDAAAMVTTKKVSVTNIGQKTVEADYNYMAAGPQDFLPEYWCNTLTNKCDFTNRNQGFIGRASGVASSAIRESYKAEPRATSMWGALIGAVSHKTTKQAFNELSERNAQEIAVINAMAIEAFEQANNRNAIINNLRNDIDKGDTRENNLKRAADLQAQLQAVSLDLTNEQSRLTTLSILQESQRDAYHERKRSIAKRIFRTVRDEDSEDALFGTGLGSALLAKAKRAAIMAASWGALQALASDSADVADPNGGSSNGEVVLNIPGDVFPSNTSLRNVITTASAAQWNKEVADDITRVANNEGSGINVTASNAGILAYNDSIAAAQVAAQGAQAELTELERMLTAEDTEFTNRGTDRTAGVEGESTTGKTEGEDAFRLSKEPAAVTAGQARSSGQGHGEETRVRGLARTEEIRVKQEFDDRAESIVLANDRINTSVGGLANSVNNLANTATSAVQSAQNSSASSAVSAQAAAQAAASAAAAAAASQPAPSVP